MLIWCYESFLVRTLNSASPSFALLSSLLSIADFLEGVCLSLSQSSRLYPVFHYQEGYIPCFIVGKVISFVSLLIRYWYVNSQIELYLDLRAIISVHRPIRPRIMDAEMQMGAFGIWDIFKYLQKVETDSRTKGEMLSF